MRVYFQHFFVSVVENGKMQQTTNLAYGIFVLQCELKMRKFHPLRMNALKLNGRSTEPSHVIYEIRRIWEFLDLIENAKAMEE